MLPSSPSRTLYSTSETADDVAGTRSPRPRERHLRVVKNASAGSYVQDRGTTDAIQPGRSPIQSLPCVDDDASVIALAEGLSGGSYVVDVVPDGEIGHAKILPNPPDLVVCFMWMQDLGGLELLRQHYRPSTEFANIPFVVLIGRHDRDSEPADQRLGADGYVTKLVDVEMLRVFLANRLQGAHGHRAPKSQVHLTRREREVLTWVGRGKTSAEIAIILGRSERTVNFHCDRAIKRLNVINRTQAVATAIWQGSISI